MQENYSLTWDVFELTLTLAGEKVDIDKNSKEHVRRANKTKSIFQTRFSRLPLLMVERMELENFKENLVWLAPGFCSSKAVCGAVWVVSVARKNAIDNRFVC